MIQENKYFFLAILVFLTLTSCQSTKNTETFEDKLTTTVSKENNLFVNYSDGTKQILSSEGIGYNTKMSPNNKFITVDVAKFSNLQITKLFERQSDGKFLETKNLSSIAWKNFCKTNNIQMEDISNPRSRVVRLSNDEVVMELSGIGEKQKSIFEGIKIKLKQ